MKTFISQKAAFTFQEHYRTSFPHATIIPKLHLLEDHVLPWVRRWRVGSGLMGEQGTEQILVHIHRLETVYSGIADLLQCLKYIIHEHMLQTAPALTTLQPPPPKKKEEWLNSPQSHGNNSNTKTCIV